MKNNSWLKISFIVALIGFVITWLLSGNWKVALILGFISGLMSLFYNPATRYMRVFWYVLSVLVGINSFTLKIVTDFYNSFLSGNVKSEIGNASIILSVLLAILCVVTLILDFLERNKKVKLFGRNKRVKKEKVNMSQIGGANSKNYQSKGDINIS